MLNYTLGKIAQHQFCLQKCTKFTEYYFSKFHYLDFHYFFSQFLSIFPVCNPPHNVFKWLQKNSQKSKLVLLPKMLCFWSRYFLNTLQKSFIMVERWIVSMDLVWWICFIRINHLWVTQFFFSFLLQSDIARSIIRTVWGNFDINFPICQNRSRIIFTGMWLIFWTNPTREIVENGKNSTWFMTITRRAMTRS